MTTGETTQPNVGELAAALEQIVRELTALQRELSGLASEHRSALRAADGLRVTALAFERDRINARLTELNGHRATIARQILTGSGLAISGDSGPTIRDVLQALGEPAATSLTVAADELRTAILDTQREHSVLRDATAAVAGQLGGVLTRVLGACSGANTYNATGRLAIGAQVPGTLDVRH